MDGSVIRNSIIGARAVIKDSELHDSMVGGSSRIERFRGSLSVADHSEVSG